MRGAVHTTYTHTLWHTRGGMGLGEGAIMATKNTRSYDSEKK